MTLIDRSLQNIRFSKVKKFVGPGSKILDVGCENGELYQYLGKNLKKYVGIDVQAVRREVNDFNFINGSFPEDLPIGNKEFDAVVMLAVVEHLDEKSLAKLNQTCHDILKQHGLLIMTIPSPVVDKILLMLRALKIVHAETLHEHHGFLPDNINNYILENDFDLICHEKFELGLNNLFVFQKK
ncbi:MAG: class I SAM-dependent methyltransferase [Candidatus Paceibacterota bacterium]